MTNVSRGLAAFTLAGCLLAARSAEAQVAFPPDSLWIPLSCDGLPMTDPFQDEAGFFDESDIVGDLGAPAGFHSADAELLYIRLRLDRDPAPGGALQPFSWGIEIDLDGNILTYELLILVDGVGGGNGSVRIFRDLAITQQNDPSDPADQPPVASFAFADNARSIDIDDGVTFGGDTDFYLDFAVPWSELVPLGLDRNTPISVWVGSSSTGDSLDGDLACHDGRSGAPTLDGTASDETAGDPALDSDGDGFTDAEELEGGSDPNDPNSVPLTRLEGGGGCAAGGGALGIAFVFAFVVVLGSRRRRR